MVSSLNLPLLRLFWALLVGAKMMPATF